MKFSLRQCILLLGTMLILPGCATTANYQRAVESWVGHSSDELIQAWGPPVSEYKLNNGSKILTYVFDGGSVGYANYNPYLNTTIINQSRQSCKTMFTVDQFDRVTYWQYEGNMCRSYASK